jgi:hypothetical protein
MNNDAMACHKIPTISPTLTPVTSNVCRVSFDLPDTAVCWKNPRSVPITYTVYSLPSTGGPFYMETDWFVASPVPGPHHYTVIQQIQAGGKYTVYADWPGIPDGENRNVEIHAGLNVRDKNGNLITPNCTGAIDYYWTPYVSCPTPALQ